MRARAARSTAGHVDRPRSPPDFLLENSHDFFDELPGWKGNPMPFADYRVPEICHPPALELGTVRCRCRNATAKLVNQVPSDR